jgi:glucose-6-phosphate isomerase
MCYWDDGRTSELSAVGLLPAALQRIDVESLVARRKACDEVKRCRDVNRNPSAQLFLGWFYIGNGKVDRNMVILPYKDPLQPLSKLCEHHSANPDFKIPESEPVTLAATRYRAL